MGSTIRPFLFRLSISVVISLFTVGAHAAEVNNVDAVPFLNDAGRDGYRDFLEEPEDRAFALSPSGAWSWASARKQQPLENRKKKAIRRCEKFSSTPCYLYAVNKEVVYDGPAWDKPQKLRVDSLGVSIELPERWKRSCKDTITITNTLDAYPCVFKDSKEKATVILKVIKGGGDIDAWGVASMKRFIKSYASDNGSPLSFERTPLRSVAVTLSNGSSATAVHERYNINDNRRYVSQLMFTHNGLNFWLVAFNVGDTNTIEGTPFNQIVSSIVFK